jgi:formylglycine-generating enzyme required for sulfatase activity
MMKLFTGLALVLLFTGCGLFRPSLQTRMAPMDMTAVPGGTFVMGDIIKKKNEDSLPLHEVTLNDFYIGTYEVTYHQYDIYAAETDKPFPRDDGRGRGDRALVYINWYDAVEFCNAYGYRLPTEQEWEYASRSGGKYQLYAGTSDPDSLSNYVRYSENSGAYTYSVGTKSPNEAGIFDMSGNVSEFVGNYYPFYKTDPDSIEYYPLEERAMRVVRGGSFNNTDNVLRTYWRVGVLAELGDHTIGFRCAYSSGDE